MQRERKLAAFESAIDTHRSPLCLLVLPLILCQVAIYAHTRSSTVFMSTSASVPPAEWLALLDFKAHIAKSIASDAILGAWNESNMHNICKTWVGITCSSSPSEQHISAINLTGFGLSGSLSPFVGNRTLLLTLDLSWNLLSGSIPPSLASLSNLEVFDVCGNKLSGSIPHTLVTNCTRLYFLGLCGNSLQGPIPAAWRLPRLQYMTMFGNNLTGPIPPSIGLNCTELLELDLSSNFLSGSIAHELGFLVKLQHLGLTQNMLTGVIPSSFARCKSLQELFLDENTLTGGIGFLGSLINLQIVQLHGNMFRGGIPRSLGNCTALQGFEISSNQLSGGIPIELGNLANLSILSLFENHLNGTIPRNLGNCTKLIDLRLNTNQLIGSIPNEIKALSNLQSLQLSFNSLLGFEQPDRNFSSSRSLFEVDLAFNLIGGLIPLEFGQLQVLQGLNLGGNQFTGLIPWDVLCNCTSLIYLRLFRNHLNGTLSRKVQNLSKLQGLWLHHNLLQGSIPDFGHFQPLTLDASYNQLTGILPDSLANVLENVVMLNFSHNIFSGDLPPWLGRLSSVQEMDLSNNHFEGVIPESIRNCLDLSYLNLSANRLVGEIPPGLGNISTLISVDVSSNHLAGPLPSTLEHLPHLGVLNVSFNDLEGPIPAFGAFKHLDPESFDGNPGLCGALIHKPCYLSQPPHAAHHLHRKKYIIIALVLVLGSITGALIVMICLCYKYRWWPKAKGYKVNEKLKKLGKVRRFSAIGLSESTQGYSEGNVLGEGALSVVYRGVLPNGELIAIKKFKEVGCAREALLKEVNIMSKLRHKNLVKVLGYVLNLEVHALVLEYMPNGTLEKFLQQHIDSERINLEVILRIAQGVANALAYLHHEYDLQSIIHGDVKPSNILLDSDFEAHLADFGLAKLAKEETSLSSNIKGSIGYMAPEIAYAAKMTNKVDIYSFGVVVLEMMAGIGPTHQLLQGVTLDEWVKSKLSLSQDDVLIRERVHASYFLRPSLRERNDPRVELLLQMALACMEALPNRRPSMHKIQAFLDSKENWSRPLDRFQSHT